MAIFGTGDYSAAPIPGTQLYAGYTANGTLTLTNGAYTGGAALTEIFAGVDFTAVATHTGDVVIDTNSSVAVSGSAPFYGGVFVGTNYDAGGGDVTGTLTITGGSDVTVTADLTEGEFNGRRAVFLVGQSNTGPGYGGTATVDGSGSTLTLNGDGPILTIGDGNGGNGQFTIENSASVTVSSVYGMGSDRTGAEVAVGKPGGSDGKLYIDNGSLTVQHTGGHDPGFPFDGAHLYVGGPGVGYAKFENNAQVSLLGARAVLGIALGGGGGLGSYSEVQVLSGSDVLVDSQGVGEVLDFFGPGLNLAAGAGVFVGGGSVQYTGALLVSGAGTTLDVTSTSNVADDTSTGQIEISRSGTATFADQAAVTARRLEVNGLGNSAELNLNSGATVSLEGMSGAYYNGAIIANGGTANIDGMNTVLTTGQSGSGAGVFRVGDTNGNADAYITDGATVNAFFTEIGRGRMGGTPTGRLFVDGVDSALNATDEFGNFNPMLYGPQGGVVRFGREGGTGRGYITDGGAINVGNAAGSMADFSVLTVGRGEGATTGYGYLFIGRDDALADATTSSVNVVLTGPSNDGYDPGNYAPPIAHIGRTGGYGTVMVADDGLFRVSGEGASLQIGLDAGIGAVLAPLSSAQVTGDGEIRVSSLGYNLGAYLNVGTSALANGSLTVTGPEASVTVESSNAPANDAAAYAAALAVGRGGMGVATFTGGATVNIDGDDDRYPFFGAGFDATGDGMIMVSGLNTSVVIEGGSLVEALSGGLINIGRFGAGSLSISGGAVVANDNPNSGTIIGREAGSTGMVMVDGTVAPSLGYSAHLLAGTVLTVGSDYDFALDAPLPASGGTGMLILANGGIVDGGAVTVGNSGEISGDGTVVGNVEVIGGTISPGASPGTLVIDGNFAADADASVVIEVDGLDPGQFDLIDVSGTASADLAAFEFDFSLAAPAVAGTTITLIDTDLGFNLQSVNNAALFDALDPLSPAIPPVGPTVLLSQNQPYFLFSDTEDFRLEALALDSGGPGGVVDFGAGTIIPVDLTAVNGYGTGTGGEFDEPFALLGVTSIAGTAAADDITLSTSSDVTIDGRFGPDTLVGGTGDDSLTGGLGDDRLIGGLGMDVAFFAGNRGTFIISQDGANVTVIDLLEMAGFEGTDLLTGIETLRFADMDVIIDFGAAVPDSNADSYSTGFGVELVRDAAQGVLANDSGGAPLSAVEIDGPTDGSLSLNSDGSFIYNPDPGFVGVDSFTYVANDGILTGPITAVTIVVGANQAPVPLDDAFMGVEDTELVIPIPGVLGNDTDPEAGALSAALQTDAANGTVVIGPGGNFTYTPDENFFGEDSFSYLVSDAGGATATGTATITVAHVNDAPEAMPDMFLIGFGEVLEVGPGQSLLTNDSDVDPGDTLTAELVSGPSNGNLVLNPDGTFTYSHDPNFFGPDSFTYRASDGLLASAPVQVVIGVMGNAPPVAVNDRFLTAEDTPIPDGRFSVLANDFDPDGLSSDLTATLDRDAFFGSVTLGPDGEFSYVPDPDFTGLDSFTYFLEDDFGDVASGFVVLEVTPVNDPPIGVADAFAASFNTPLNSTASVLDNDIDIDGPGLSAVLASAPGAGAAAFSLNPDGTFSFTPEAEFIGDVSFTYRPTDGLTQGPETTATISVAANAIPVAVADAFALDEDGVLEVAAPGLLANDTDADAAEGELMVSLVEAAANGSLALNPDGGFTYTPAADFFGEDSFTYQVSDSFGGVDTASVSLTIAPVNDAPMAVGESYEALFGTTLVVSAMAGVLDNDSDPEGDPLMAELVSGPARGDMLFRADGSFEYTPDPGFFGEDSFSYRPSDGTDAGTPVTVALFVLDPNNIAPVAGDDAFATLEDVALPIGFAALLANDSDADLDPLSVSLVSGPANGVLAAAEDGFLYTPAPGFFGGDAFIYQISDGRGGMDEGRVEIDVAGVNDPPMAVDDAIAAGAGGFAFGDVLADNGGGADSDPDGDPLQVAAVNGMAAAVGNPLALASGASVTLTADGVFVYDPRREVDEGFADGFTYDIADGNGGTATASVTVTLAADGPVQSGPIEGTEAADVLPAPGADPVVIQGLDGDDTILGGPGDDLIIGGAGGDAIAPGGGTDRIIFGIAEGEPGFGVDMLVGTAAELDGDSAFGLRSNDRVQIVDDFGNPLAARLIIGDGVMQIDVGGDGSIEAEVLVDRDLRGIGTSFTGENPFLSLVVPGADGGLDGL